jgi:tripartite-type tricarboxylate transporter receptor subunit TctC
MLIDKPKGGIMKFSRIISGMLAIMIIFSGLLTLRSSEAAEWPTRPINIIVPANPGGSIDTLARGIASELRHELGVGVRIVNRPGANTMIGITSLMASKKDGSYIMVSVQPYLSNTILLQNAAYKIEDLDFINVEQVDPVTFTVHADSPYKTMGELLKAIKANPGKLSLGTSPLGSQHLGLIILSEKLSLDVRTVMYSSGGPYRTALLGKHVDMISGTAAGDTVMQPNARALAIYDDEPFSGWPQAELMNDVLKPYGVKVPNLSNSRFVAVHKSFKQNYPERYKKLVNAYKKVYFGEPYTKFRKKTHRESVSRWMGPEKSNEFMKQLHTVTAQYKDKLKPAKK